ncbi:hypothetical protein PTKIN_Ptkin14bG0040100 [Pterospermum kingtungense]
MLSNLTLHGAARGHPGSAAIGGALRDSAVKEAFKLFSSSKWVKEYELDIESDSFNVVQWVSNPDRAPWRLRGILVEMDNLKKLVPSIKHIFRDANQVADGLAKFGIDRLQEILMFFDN